MFSPRHQASAILSLIIVIFCSGCVYYNTFFHARQKFKEAEKSQKENTERLGQTQPSPANPSGQRQPGAVPQKQTGEQPDPMVNVQEKNLYKDAIAKANKVLQYHPDSKWADDALWLIGKSYFNMGDYLLADRKFKELVTNHPKSKFADESYYFMGLSQMFLGHNDQALSAFASLQDINKKSPYLEDMLFAEGAMEMNSENYPRASELFANYVEKYPGGDSSARAMYNLGLCHEKQNDFTGAYRAYSLVEKHEPDRLIYFDATLAAATASLKSDSVELGMKILDKLAKDERYFSRSGEIRLRVAEGQFLQGLINEAIETYGGVISANPSTIVSAEAYYRLGLIYQNEKFDLNSAKEAFSKAQQEAPNSKFKNLALARSAQIAKLESYQVQLQRADSLKKADELNALGIKPNESAILEIAPDTSRIDTTIASADSIANVPPADSVTALQVTPSGEDTTSLTETVNTPMNISVADTIDQAGLIDSTIQQATQTDTIAVPDSVFARMSKVERMRHILGIEAPPDTIAQTAIEPMDTVFLGQQDTSAQVTPTPVVNVPAPSNPPTAQPLNQDSIRASILRTGIETRYMLSELYAYELNRPDSAINEYLLIASEHPSSPFAPKSLLAAAQVELSRGDTAAALPHLQRVIGEYPDSPQAARAAEILNSPFEMSGNALGLYASAESLVYYGGNPDSALALFGYIAEKYPDLAPKASFARAWILDRIIGVEDSSAFFAYTSVAAKYPETAYAQAANERLGIASSQNNNRKPPKPSQQTQDQQKPIVEEGDETDSTQQLIAGDLPLAPRAKKVYEFVYPEALLSRDLRGKVIFKIRLDIAGMVKDYELIGPSGETAIDSVATEALIRTEFDITELDLAQLDGYFQYSIPFKRPNVTIYDDPYRDLHDTGGR
jgi:TolA-binding protein